MADFDNALAVILQEEGGYNPADPSMHGVTQTTYDTYRDSYGLDRQDVRAIGDDEVYEIYQTVYWQGSGADAIAASGNYPLALFHFDTAVNLGLTPAKQLRAAAGDDLGVYANLRSQRYHEIAAANPAKHGADLPIWLSRVASVLKIAKGGAGLTAAGAVLIVVMGAIALKIANRHQGRT